MECYATPIRGAVSISTQVSRGLAGQDLSEVWQASWAVHVALHGAFSYASCAAWGSGLIVLCQFSGIFQVTTLFQKLWLLLYKCAELDLRSTKFFLSHFSFLLLITFCSNFFVSTFAYLYITIINHKITAKLFCSISFMSRYKIIPLRAKRVGR